MKKQESAIEQALASQKSTNSVSRQEPAAAPDGVDEETFNAVVDELTKLIAAGQLPADFDLMAACSDDKFMELVMQYPVEAAVRVYDAERRADEAEQAAMQRVRDSVRARGSLPRSLRGGASVSPQVNYRDMDSDSFRRLLGDVKKAARDGKTPRL